MEVFGLYYLVEQYKDSLHKVQRLKHRLSEERTSRTYRERIDKETKQVKRVVTSVEKQPVTDPETILTGIVDSLTYSIEWLEHNREPGLRRGADRRSREQREVLTDPLGYMFDQSAFVRWQNLQVQVNGEVSQRDKERLEDILDVLSPQEREAFVLVKGKGFSQYEAARIMKISRTSIQDAIERAERKLQITNQSGIQRVMFGEIC